MGGAKPKTDAFEILHKRYIGDDFNRKESLREERVNVEVARTIYELRKEAGLTQKELADLVDTTQSVISRLEDADYEGHSLAMLSRIAKALNQRISLQVIPKNPDHVKARYVFSELLKRLRRERGLSINDFAKEVGIDVAEVTAMERDISFRPSPLTLHKISKFYNIPERRIYALAGAIKDLPNDLEQQVIKFAAQSDSFSKLTNEEKQILREFVNFLREEELIS